MARDIFAASCKQRAKWGGSLSWLGLKRSHWTAHHHTLRPKAGHAVSHTDTNTHTDTSLKSRFETDGVHHSHIRRSWVGSPEVEQTAVTEVIISREQAGHHFRFLSPAHVLEGGSNSNMLGVFIIRGGDWIFFYFGLSWWALGFLHSSTMLRAFIQGQTRTQTSVSPEEKVRETDGSLA